MILLVILLLGLFFFFEMTVSRILRMIFVFSVGLDLKFMVFPGIMSGSVCKFGSLVFSLSSKRNRKLIA